MSATLWRCSRGIGQVLPKPYETSRCENVATQRYTQRVTLDPMLLAAFATAALLVASSAVAAWMSPTHLRHNERLLLLTQHVVCWLVILTAALCATLGGGSDGRSLFVCAAGPIAVLCAQDARGTRTVFATAPLMALGFVAQLVVIAKLASELWTGLACALLAAATVGMFARACLARAAISPAPRQRRWLRSQALVLSAIGAAALIGALPGVPLGTWSVALAAVCAIATAQRYGAVPVSARDLVAAPLLAAFAAAALSLAGGEWALAAALWTLFVPVTVMVMLRGAARSVPHVQAPALVPAGPAGAPSAYVLASMAPILDRHDLPGSPHRPRVTVRVAARRVLDAALERARTTQRVSRTVTREANQPHAAHDGGRVDVVAVDNDIDVEADAGEIAEALCAIFEEAFRLREHAPATRVQVHLRGGPHTVTFEFVCTAPVADDEHTRTAQQPPTDSDARDDVVMPTLDPYAPVLGSQGEAKAGLGVSLRRARLLVERNGGQLVSRSAPQSTAVHVSLPRRRPKGSVGLA